MQPITIYYSDLCGLSRALRASLGRLPLNESITWISVRLSDSSFVGDDDELIFVVPTICCKGKRYLNFNEREQFLEEQFRLWDQLMLARMICVSRLAKDPTCFLSRLSTDLLRELQDCLAAYLHKPICKELHKALLD